MGKGALMLVLASFMAMSLAYVSRDESQYNSALVRADYEESVLARETAESAYNIIVSKVKNDFDNYRGTLTDKDLRSGTYDVTAAEEVDGSVTVTATGLHGNHEYEITGTISRSAQRLLDALTVDGPIDDTDFNNDYQISGLNTDPDGSDAGGIDVHAVLTTSSSANTLLNSEFDAGQVVGVDGNLDVINEAPLVDLDALGAAILAYNGARLTSYSGDQTFDSDDVFGTLLNPAIVRVAGDLKMKNSANGFGVLYVDGKLKMQNDARWTGLVFVTGNGDSHEFKNDSAVYGAVILRTVSGGTGSEGDGSWDGESDRGLLGGHFDVDVFTSSTDKEIYHEHQYDDKYNVTGVDLMNAGCKKGGLCWDNVFGSGAYDSVDIEFINAGFSQGTYSITAGSSVYTGSTESGFSQTINPQTITNFTFDFTSLCALRGTQPGEVQDDISNRDNAFAVRIYRNPGGSGPAQDDDDDDDDDGEGKSEKSKKSKKSKKSEKGEGGAYTGSPGLLIYEVSIYHHIKNDSAACSDNADPDSEEGVAGSPMTLKLKNNAVIVYSAKALKPLRALIALIDIQENQITARKLTELPRKKIDAVLKYR